MKYAKFRLSLLMFVQFFAMGAINPVISLYLRDCLSFSGAQIGLVLGLAAVSSVVSPVIMTFLADRLISSERLLCLLNVIAGACMIIFSMQTEFYPVLFIYFMYNMAVIPSIPLINAITFHHSPSDREKFGNIRLWGTAGWIAVAWFFSFVILRDGGSAVAREGSRLPLLLWVSALTSFIMAVYSLTIPKHGTTEDKTWPANDAGANPRASRFFPIDALRVIMRPRVFALSLLTAAYTFLDRFYALGVSPFLRQAGFSERTVMPAMTLGQIPEIAAMGLLALMLRRWDAKMVLAFGTAMSVFRFAAYALGSSKLLIYTGLGTHGLAFTFTMITALICLDRFCGEQDRTGVHQLFAVLTGGIGGFSGSYAAGLTLDLFTDPVGMVNYNAYWSVPMAVSGVILVMVFRMNIFPSKACADAKI
jgi:MFS family permease